MNKSLARAVVFGGIFVLIVGIVLQLTWRVKVLPGKGKHLPQVLPSALTGWASREVSLGTTEAEGGAVEQTLRFDDVYFREFSSALGTISVYVAYWNPGKMPVQLVASHTPDRCWVEGGWQTIQQHHDNRIGGLSVMLRLGEGRVFVAPNNVKLNVQFWQLVGNETFDFGENATPVPSAWRWWREASKQIFRSPEEQYFIRLTSVRPFEELAGDPGWEEMLRSLAKLGLAQQ